MMTSHVLCRSRQQTELGKIVNLMSADVNHVMQFFYPFFNQLFSAPALLITSLILLYFQIRFVAWEQLHLCHAQELTVSFMSSSLVSLFAAFDTSVGL